jgi:hypothetical protein
MKQFKNIINWIDSKIGVYIAALMLLNWFVILLLRGIGII